MAKDESIQEQIQQTYQAWEKDPDNQALSLRIGQLYVQRKEYANAIPWFQNAYDLGKRADATLELAIISLRLKAFAQEIDFGRQELEAESDPKSRRQLKTIIDAKLDELSELLRLKKEIEKRQGPSN